jgi:hypothetical protein
VRVGPYKAHLFTVMPEEGHAGPDRGYLKNMGDDRAPYGAQAPYLLFDIEKDPSEMFPIHPGAFDFVLAFGYSCTHHAALSACQRTSSVGAGGLHADSATVPVVLCGPLQRPLPPF